MRFVVLSSSRGTVFEAVLKTAIDSKCAGLISDREDRGCVAVAKKFNVPVKIVAKNKGESREDYDRRLDAAIRGLMPESGLIACMGWMWMLSPWFVRQWANKILNVHPALLPKHPGAHAHELVLAAKEKESGMTIHLIDEGMDTGKILLQKTCPVMPDDTAETLKARVQKLECEWFPKVLGMIERGEMAL